MRLSKIAILAIRGLGQGVKERIAEATDTSQSRVYEWILENKDNGRLTLSAVVQIISEETGLTQDQILESVEETKVIS
jgi:hypothetical protein